MKTITIFYWSLRKSPDLDLEHNQDFEYSQEKLQELILYVLDKGYSVMLRPYKDAQRILLAIDDGRFGQK